MIGRRWSFFRRVKFDLISASASAVRSGVRRLLEGLGLRERVIITLMRRFVETISLTEVIRAIPYIFRQVTETVALNEFIQINSILRRVVSEVLEFTEDVVARIIQLVQAIVTETIEITENVVAQTITTIYRLVTETLDIAEDVVARIIQYITRIVSESVDIAEEVITTINQQGGEHRWDYFLAYNHNNQPMQVDDSPMRDNNTSTYVTFYYTPPAPQNLRRGIIGFNNPQYYFMISFYIIVNTSGKYLIVNVYDSYGNSDTYAVYPTQGNGWYDVYIDYYNINNVKEVEIMTDSSYFGSLSVAEVVFIQQQ